MLQMCVFILPDELLLEEIFLTITVPPDGIHQHGATLVTKSSQLSLRLAKMDDLLLEELLHSMSSWIIHFDGIIR